MKHKRISKEFKLKEGNVLYSPYIMDGKFGFVTTLIYEKDGCLYAYSSTLESGVWNDGALNLINDRTKGHAEYYFKTYKDKATKICEKIINLILFFILPEYFPR